MFGASDLPLRASLGSMRQFWTAEVFQPVSPICYQNLQRSYFAKQQIAASRQLLHGDVILEQEIHDFLGVDALACPDGGVLRYNSVFTYPTCSLSGHYLLEQ
jgi:hypothetical protein